MSRYEPDQIATLVAEGADNEPLKPITLGELIVANPVMKEPLIEGLLRKGETSNVIAKSKVGKSWLSYGLGWSIATGGKWFGRFQCTQGRVLLIDNELHGESLAHRIPRVAQAMGIDPAAVADDFHVLTLRGRLKSLDELLPVIREIPHGRYSLIMLDAWYRLFGPGQSENDNAVVAGMFNRLDQYSGMTGAAFQNVHHASKGQQGDKDVVDVGSGAGSQSRAADTHIVLRPHEEPDSVVLDAAVRSWAPVEPIGLRWQFPLWIADGNLDPQLLKGMRSGGDRQRKLPRSTRTAKRSWQPCRQRDQLRFLNKLVTNTGIGRDRLGRIVGLLKRGGRITATEATIKGNGCELYAVNPKPPKRVPLGDYSQAVELSDEF